MTDYHIEIENLPPMRVASFWAYGAEPELPAMEKLMAWARPKNLLDDLETNRVYGFNHPMASPSTPNYGYEYWIQVGEDVVPEEGMRVGSFEGGQFAVVRIQGSPDAIMAPGWGALVAWVEEQGYEPRYHGCLERHVRFVDLPVEEWVFELCMPIER